MFKVSILPIVFLCTCAFEAQTKLDLYQDDAHIGTGSYVEQFDHKGHKTSEFKLTAKTSGGREKIQQTKVIDAKAYPIREEEHIVIETDEGPIYDTVLKVHYDDTGAAVVTQVTGRQKEQQKTTERTFIPPPGYSRADPSDLWFCKNRPDPGTTVHSTVFDVEHGHWQIVVTTYVGRKRIMVAGRDMEAHEIRDIRDGQTRMVYLDDKGIPLLMISGQSRTERHFGK